MSSNEQLNDSIKNIIQVAEKEVCEQIPKIMQEKSQQIFDKVLEIITSKRDEIRKTIKEDFKTILNEQIINDNEIKQMLIETLTEGVKNVFAVEEKPIKGGKKMRKTRKIRK